MEIKLNQWYKCNVFSSDYWYIKFDKIDFHIDSDCGNTGYYGNFIEGVNYHEKGGWELDDLVVFKEINLPIVCELFDSKDKDNIIIALEILKQKQ